MKKGLTEIVCILDKSGSMATVANDVIGGFNKFIEDQKKLSGEASVTVVFFDSPGHYDLFCNRVQVSKVPALSNDSYCPGGGTALLDAIGQTIDEVGARLSSTPEQDRPEKVIFVIMTDGEENSSIKYTSKMVRDRINHQSSVYQWKFEFIGASLSDIENKAIGIFSSSIGVHAYSAFSGEHRARDAYGYISNAVSSLRSDSTGG